MDPAARQYPVAYCRDDTRRLPWLLDRDLSGWLR
jgi:hypothetical protein